LFQNLLSKERSFTKKVLKAGKVSETPKGVSDCFKTFFLKKEALPRKNCFCFAKIVEEFLFLFY